MNDTQRVLTIFGTRPEAIKLFPVLHRLAQDDRFESRVCVTGQHRSMLDQVLRIADISAHHDLAVMKPDQSLDSLSARLITMVGEVIDQEKPNWVVVQGDTTTATMGALAAYYRKIPVAHVEAGLRSDDIYQPWPEEVNRKIISTIAVLHCAPTELSAEALRLENVASPRIHVTGNTVIDALQWMARRIERDPQLACELAEIERKHSARRIIAVTTHRRENFGDGFAQIANAIRRLAARDDVAIIFPVHLNPNVQAIMQNELRNLDNVALLEPLDYPHFVRLLDIAHIVLTDSGGIQEEAPAFGKPVLVMRDTTERPEGVNAGTARLVGTDADRIVREAERLLDDPAAYDQMSLAHNPFGDGRASERILDLLASARRL